MPRKPDERKKLRFLDAYAQVGIITKAAELVGTNRNTVNEWRKVDPVFAERMEQAKEDAADRLEDEARRRAYEGVEEPVYQGGKLVGLIRKYSDTLLIFMLKGVRPHKYRERIEHSGDEDKPIHITVTGPPPSK